MYCFKEYKAPYSLNDSNSDKHHKLWYCAILSEAEIPIARSNVTDMKVPSQVMAARRADSWGED